MERRGRKLGFERGKNDKDSGRGLNRSLHIGEIGGGEETRLCL